METIFKKPWRKNGKFEISICNAIKCLRLPAVSFKVFDTNGVSIFS